MNIKDARKKFYENFGTEYKTQKLFYEAVSTLCAREQKVLKMRYGLDDGCFLSPEEMGIRFNVTGTRIRQIEAKALRFLRGEPGDKRKDTEYERHSWKKFRETGLLIFINQFLQIFGWSIILEVDTETEEITFVYPKRTKWRGFSEKDTDKAYTQVTKYLENNITELKHEVE
jgi:hypothetical protein